MRSRGNGGDQDLLQDRRSQRLAKTRARVESIDANLDQMGGKALRSIGLDRATLHLKTRRLARLRSHCGNVRSQKRQFEASL